MTDHASRFKPLADLRRKVSAPATFTGRMLQNDRPLEKLTGVDSSGRRAFYPIRLAPHRRTALRQALETAGGMLDLNAFGTVIGACYLPPSDLIPQDFIEEMEQVHGISLSAYELGASLPLREDSQ